MNLFWNFGTFHKCSRHFFSFPIVSSYCYDGPFPGYLHTNDFTLGANNVYSTLSAAMAACSSSSQCRGFTQTGSNAFALRKGTTLVTSAAGEVSYLRKTYGTCLTGDN